MSDQGLNITDRMQRGRYKHLAYQKWLQDFVIEKELWNFIY